jgi:Cu+-exporting ATPase
MILIHNTMKKETFQIDGMHCAGCVNTVQKTLNNLDGVSRADVNLANETALVEYDESRIAEADLQKAVEGSGYTLVKKKSESHDQLKEKRDREQKKLDSARGKMIRSWAVTIPVMIWMLLEMVFGLHLTSMLVMELFMTAAAIYVIFSPGMETVKSAWKSSLNLSPNMDVLIALGTVASLSTGFMAITGQLGFMQFDMHSFAGIGAMIMAFHLSGRYIETKAKGHASDAITKLLTLEATTARVVRNGKESEIPVRELKVGDVMIVRPGEKVPADGVIIDGSSTLNEAMITGESMPVMREKGDKVIGGTLNEEGSIRVKAEKIGEDTFLKHVIRMVEEAQGTRVPVQELADKITAVFVPVILIVALLTFAVWMIFPGMMDPILVWAEAWVPWVQTDATVFGKAFFASLAVLVIACPCALGLATPTALMVGTGLGAENGILIRKGEAIQLLTEVTHIVFDKTGTITEGKPKVTGVEVFDEVSENELIMLAASVENLSEHPISRAIVDYAAEKNIEQNDVEGFKSYAGKGVSGTIDNKNVVVGNIRLMEEQDIRVPAEKKEKAESLESEGNTVVYVAADQTILALISVADTLKPDSVEAIQALKRMGYKTWMLTGDNERVAKAIAGEAGIDDVMAGVLPDGKADAIKNLQENGAIVMMVGDGVNDAPALATADVGVALGTGTDIAIESGSVVIMDGKLTAVVKALNLGEYTFKKIKQNLFWAFIYNVVMIPVAIIGLMHPVLAEAAMAVSSVSVIGNSKRLQKSTL